MATAAQQVKGIPVCLTPHQSAYVQSRQFIKGLVAGRGAGKTWVGAFDAIANSRHNDEIMAVSPSYVMLEDTTYPTFRAVAESLGVWIRGVKSPVPRAWFVSREGGRAEIIFRSGENPDSLRGPSKSRLWLDEAALMHPDVLKYALPVLRHKGRLGQLALTTTPKGRTHWTFDVFYKRLGIVMDLEQSEDGRQLLDGAEIFSGIAYSPNTSTKLIQAHSSQNPFLPPEFVDQMASQYSEQLAEQELGGQFVLIVGDMFNRGDFALIDMAPKAGQRVRYWDRAADDTGEGSETASCRMLRTEEGPFPFVIEDIKHGFWRPKQRDQIIEETAIRDAAETGNQCLIYLEQEGGSAGKEVAEQMVRRLARFPVYSDVVSGKRSKQKDGLRLPGEAKITRARPFSTQVEAGNVAMVRGPWIHDALDQLCIARGSLVATTRGQKPIQQIEAGDVVHTRDGPRPVKTVAYTPKRKDVVLIQTRQGRRLIATRGHRIWTITAGWTTAESIQKGETLLAINLDKDPARHGFCADYVWWTKHYEAPIDCWDLEIDGGPPEFFASEILVHNSAFPDSDRADIVDACSGAFAKLAKGLAPGEFKPPASMKRDTSGAARFGALLEALDSKKRTR